MLTYWTRVCGSLQELDLVLDWSATCSEGPGSTRTSSVSSSAEPGSDKNFVVPGLEGPGLASQLAIQEVLGLQKALSVQGQAGLKCFWHKLFSPFPHVNKAPFSAKAHPHIM